MKAVLLCAGFGTRLHPLTRDFPKPLLPVRGRPLVDDFVGQLLATRRIEAFTVVTNGRFAAHFEAWCAELRARAPGLAVELVNDGAQDDASRLGAVRDLAAALGGAAPDAPVLVAAGDNLFRFDLPAFLADHAEAPRNLILVHPETDAARLRRSGVAVVGEGGRVERFVEKPPEPPSDLSCPPVYVLQPGALARLPEFLAEAPGSDAPGTFLAWLVTREPVYAHVMRGTRYDVGTVESYRGAEAWLDAQDASA